MATARSLVHMIRLPLAFGEYIPFGDWFPFLYKLSPNTGSFTRGNHTKPLVHNNVKYGILICYEDISNFVLDVMEEQPNILINITNDAWFGDTHEPIIHLALSTFRVSSTGVISFGLRTRG